MMNNLTQIVEYWIKAEFAFRLGPHAYSAATQDLIVGAEEELRKAVAGKTGLRLAAGTLGISNLIECKKRKKQKKKRRRVEVDEL